MNNFKLSRLSGGVKTFVLCYLVLVLMVLAFPAYMHGQKEAERHPAHESGMGTGNVAYAHEYGNSVHEAETPQIGGNDGDEKDKVGGSHKQGESLQCPVKGAVADVEKKGKQSSHLLKAAHVHLGGHTLLFFTVGLLFALTGLRSLIRGAVFFLTTLSIIIHTVGLVEMAVLGKDVVVISMLTYNLCILFMAAAILKDMLWKADKNISE